MGNTIYNDAKIDQKEKLKVTTPAEIYVATLIGGPIAAGYLISENFKTIGSKTESKITIFAFTVLSVIFFLFAAFNPELFQRFIFILTIVNCTIAYAFVYMFQKIDIQAYLSSGGLPHKWTRTLVVSLISLFITFALLILLSTAKEFINPLSAHSEEDNIEQELEITIKEAEKNQDMVAYSNASFLSLRLKKYDDALKFAEISCNNKNGPGCYNLACAYCSKGDQEKALKYLEMSYQLKLGTDKPLRLIEPDHDSDLECLRGNHQFHQLIVKVYEGEASLNQKILGQKEENEKLQKIKGHWYGTSSDEKVETKWLRIINLDGTFSVKSINKYKDNKIEIINASGKFIYSQNRIFNIFDRISVDGVPKKDTILEVYKILNLQNNIMDYEAIRTQKKYQVNRVPDDFELKDK